MKVIEINSITSFFIVNTYIVNCLDSLVKFALDIQIMEIL